MRIGAPGVLKSKLPIEVLRSVVIHLCLEDKHLEAGAKAAGLDVATYRKQVRAKLTEAERVFDNPEGESYLQFEFADQVEDDKAACVAEMLQRVRKDES